MSKRLFVMSAAVSNGREIALMSGCRLAESEEVAIGQHVKWMKEMKPGWQIATVEAFPIAPELIAAVAQPLPPPPSAQISGEQGEG